MYWTPAERAGLKALGFILRRDWDEMEQATAADLTRAFIRAARAVKESERANRVDVSSLKPWEGRGRIETEVVILGSGYGIKIFLDGETEQERED